MPPTSAHSSSVQARAPGKIILSGEHAVVYGRPALVLAVNRYADTTIARDPHTDAAAPLTFDLPDLGVVLRYAPAELLAQYRAIAARYATFSTGALPIQQVLPQAADLLLAAFAHLAQHQPLADLAGLRVTVKMSIPLGCGMGSSAAASLSVLRAAAAWFGVQTSDADYYTGGLACEQWRHGRPSGVDVRICLQGGCLRFERGVAQPATLPAWPLYFVNTGTPQASTGECVMQVAARCGADHAVWDDFGAVTTRIGAALAGGDAAGFRAGVRENHRLLCRIGVTPARVQQFIAAIEASGGAAKICGAGEVGGGGGGMVLVSSDTPPTARCAEYGYDCLDLVGEPHGLRLL